MGEGEEVRGVSEKKKEMELARSTVTVEVFGYSKPIVKFHGELDGIMLRAVLKAINKAYKQRRHDLVSVTTIAKAKAEAKVKKEEGDGR